MWTRSLACLGLLTLLLPTIPGVASSRHWIPSGGTRASIDSMADKSHGGVPRNSVFYVYAADTETLNLGSSALGLGQGDIVYTDPLGVRSTCLVKNTGGYIQNITQEQAGPFPLAGGYTPCQIPVDGATAGVWQIEFLSPVPGVGDDGTVTRSGGNPNPIPVASPWTQGDD